MSRFKPGSPILEPARVVTMSRSKWYQGVLNVTTDVDTTFRTQHEVLVDCYDPQFIYGNFFQDDDPSRLSQLSAYTLEVVIEITIGGVQRFIDVTWGSSGKIVNVPPGAWVMSDKIGMHFKRGDRFHVRARVIPEAGGKFPHGLVGFAENGEGKMSGDQLRTTSFQAQTLAVLSPLAIYATPVKPFEVVACIGDSISLGAGNANGNVEGHLYGETGFMQLAAMRTGRGYVTLGMNGQASNSFLETSRHRRMKLAEDCKIAIVNYGTNDMTATNRTLSDIQSNLLNMWEALAIRGLKVYQTTITPRTNAASKWSTEGQIPVNDRTAGGPDSVRSQLNNWIRTVPSPHLAGIIDVASVVETAENSGLWVDGATEDGTHPNARGHNLMADVTQRAIK